VISELVYCRLLPDEILPYSMEYYLSAVNGAQSDPVQFGGAAAVASSWWVASRCFEKKKSKKQRA
jgi:hypothetical protein